MAEIGLTTPPPRAELLRQLTSRLAHVVPGMSLIAQDIQGDAGSPIDFVALGPDGRVTLVLVGEQGEDLELVGRALAQRAWVARRLPDWLQLAPNLRIRPEAGVRVVLLCSGFQPLTVSAATALGEETLGIARYRCVRNGASVEALIEHVLQPDPLPEAAPAARARSGDAPDAAPFRTGLTDEDLGLTESERSEFA